MRIVALVIVTTFVFVAGDVLSAQDWPQFRGPLGNGVVPNLEHPEKWSYDENIAWSCEIPGGGLSSPIVIGEKVFVTTADGANKPVNFAGGVADMRPKKAESPLKFKVICLKLSDGSKVWEKTLATAKPKYGIHVSNSYATESPASDGKHVFAYFAAIGLVAAIDQDGNEIWRNEIGAYPTGNGFGTGSSITVGDQKVFVQCDNDESSFVVAFDSKTGKEAWRKPRDSRTSWATPIFWENNVRNELITCGSGFVCSYDPANGETLWKMDGIGMSFSASPAANADRVFFGNSGPRSSGPLVAVSAGMSGERQFSATAKMEKMPWAKMQSGPGMSSPVVVGDYLYVTGRSLLTCYSASTGEVVYKNRIQLGSTAASLWAAGDRVFILDEKGKTLVVKCGPEFEVLATNQINGDVFWSTPAVAGKSLLIRGAKKLYCIRK